jgi:Rps23 Pro-64 3,4-dihydroxylase Tpa1-like proline 4-hydroxylase
MMAKQILDAFSETLMQDERILSPRERELLMSILQNSRAVSGNDPQIHSAVNAAIARSVGETVAQRAFTLLGSSIVEQILAGSGIAALAEETMPARLAHKSPQPPSERKQGDVPQPPGAVPQPPGVRKPGDVPQPPSAPVPQPPGVRKPGDVPQPPGAPVPQPPGVRKPGVVPQPPGAVPQPPSAPQGLQPVGVEVQQGARQSDAHSGGGVGVLEAPAVVRARSVVLDEFLAPHELDELVAYAMQHETEFQNSVVVSPSGETGVMDYSHRRSRVLMDLGKHQEVILERVRRVLPRVLEQFGMEEFPVTHAEAQITASNDGDFFRAHSDDAQEMVASRCITFVYFFHREPCPFEGGELRLHDSLGSDRHVSTGSYQTIVPQQNQIVFFPCSVLHEITAVECSSQDFADSRFTLNGWLHK